MSFLFSLCSSKSLNKLTHINSKITNFTGSQAYPAQSEELKPPKGRKTSTGNGLRITDKSNMASLANFIIPQLNEVQKNLLGTFHHFVDHIKKHYVEVDIIW